MWQLHHLAQFRAVYEHGSVSAAARALGLTQPALSRSLQKLEESVGAALFQRHTRALRPTDLPFQTILDVVRQALTTYVRPVHHLTVERLLHVSHLAHYTHARLRRRFNACLSPWPA